MFKAGGFLSAMTFFTQSNLRVYILSGGKEDKSREDR
jgi:hypothetical protein